MSALINNRLRQILDEEKLSIRELVRQLDAISKEINPDSSVHFETVRRLVNNDLHHIPLDLMYVLTKRFDLTLDQIFIVNNPEADK